MPWEGIEPPTRGSSGLRSTTELPRQLLGREGIEPSTSVLSERRSTTELPAPLPLGGLEPPTFSLEGNCSSN